MNEALHYQPLRSSHYNQMQMVGYVHLLSINMGFM
jgi:hypothetical protein